MQPDAQTRMAASVLWRLASQTNDTLLLAAAVCARVALAAQQALDAATVGSAAAPAGTGGGDIVNDSGEELGMSPEGTLAIMVAITANAS